MTTTTEDLVILSSKRSSGSSNNFSILLGASFPFKDKKFFLHKVSIPWTYYNINANNDTFHVRDTGTGNTIIVTLNDGNYTAAGIATELQRALNATANSGGTSWTVTYSDITFAYTITRTLAVYDVIMGGTILSTIGIVSAGGSFPAVSSVAPTFGVLQQIFIQIRQLPQTHFIAQSFNTVATFSVDVTAAPGTILHYQPDKYGQQVVGIPNQTLSSLDIRLVDSNNNLVSINNSDWALFLRIQ